MDTDRSVQVHLLVQTMSKEDTTSYEIPLQKKPADDNGYFEELTRAIF